MKCLAQGLTLALVLFFAAMAPARAGLYEGLAVYLRGDYAAAYREFLPLGRQGDAAAQVFLGFMYHNGRGVAQDYAEAVKWCRLAAEHERRRRAVLAKWEAAGLSLGDRTAGKEGAR